MICFKRLTIVVLVAGSMPLAKAAEPTPPHSRYALLVGCTEYPNLDSFYQLDGPANDIKLMREVLKERFGFQDIVTLSQEQQRADLRPTRQNIVDQMDRLAACVRAGDEVFIFFGGHGSQVPDQPVGDPDRDETEDGLDEVFVPADVTDWQVKKKVVGGIVDDQIRHWLTAMCDKGALVCFVADTCHSGSMSRAPEDKDRRIRHRYLPPEVLTSAEKLKDAARPKELAQLRGAVDPNANDHDIARPADDLVDTQRIGSGTRGRLTAIAAVPPNALELEQTMSESGDYSDKLYGRLSYALYQVLSNSSRPLNYSELEQRIARLYQRRSWLPLPPGFEIQGQDRAVLSKQDWTDRPQPILTRSDDGRTLQLNQGLAHGLTRGTILRVLNSSSSSFAQVRVIAVTPLSATVEPIDVAADKLPVGASCEIVSTDYGDLRVSVQVRAFLPEELRVVRNSLTAADAATVQRVSKIVEDLANEPRCLVRIASEHEAADLYLLVAQNGVYLRQPGQSAASIGATRSDYFGPDAADASLPDRLRKDLRTIAQGLNLRRLASDESQDCESDLALKVTFRRRKVTDDSWTDVSDLAHSSFTSGNIIQVHLDNVADVPADVTVLYQDSRFHILSHFPSSDEANDCVNVLQPKEDTDVLIGISDATVGWEDILVLAVAHNPRGPCVNFVMLEQEGLTADNWPTQRGNPSLLEQLVNTAMIGKADGTRGNPVPVKLARSYCVRRFSINIQSKK